MRARGWLLAFLATYVSIAWAECPSAEAVDAYVVDFTAGRVSPGFGNDLTLEDARCAQDQVVRRLVDTWGTIVGYKAGLTNKVIQERFQVGHPLRGTLLRDMLLQDGAEVPAQFGARPLYEADLIVIVRGPGLARARTLEEAAREIAFVVPFIELPDVMLDPGRPANGPALQAVNVGARLGVFGRPIPAEANAVFIEALETMTVVLEEDGKELARGPGAAILGHPLNAAMWLAQALERDGVELRLGDMLSLGSFLPPQPPKPGATGVVRYLGLPGDPAVSVSFR
jgi:2-oxo-hept-3-ene-1,7-dioate hydratase